MAFKATRFLAFFKGNEMNAPDWTAIERMRDANAYSDALNEAERIERFQAEQEARLNAACNCIRKSDLTPSMVSQILMTLGSRMAQCGFSASDVQAVDELSGMLS